MAAIRKPRSVDRSSPAWLITYGDMATLLLVFFVFLFSVSEVKEQKFKAAAGSLRASMGVRPHRGSVVESRPPLDVRRRERRQKERLGLPGESEKVLAAARGKRVAFGGRIIFDRGSADITAKAKDELRRLADEIRGLPNVVDVRGHAERDEYRLASDSTEAAARLGAEVGASGAKDDLELSLARAANVLRFLVEDGGLARRRLRAVGAGSEEPVREGPDFNRRVEILVVRELADRSDRK